MSTLLLRFAGPMQSWGVGSRFVRRTTQTAPTKSGVIGLLAAACGYARTDPLDELSRLRVAVRIDQPGRLLRDFQTARSMDGKRSMPLSYRFYLADAVFLVAVAGEDHLIDKLSEAVRRPKFPLYLGRRSCPPAGPIHLGVTQDPLAFENHRWQASVPCRRSQSKSVRLEVVRDARPDEHTVDTVRDMPESFDPAYRKYTWRSVVAYSVIMLNPVGHDDDHDPFAALEG